MAPLAKQQQLAAAAMLVRCWWCAPARRQVTCAQVAGYLTPCMSYAMGGASVPGRACCGGIKSLVAAAGTAADRQATCACLKQATAGMVVLKPDLVASIPGMCGVAIPYPISRTTDCSKVQ